MPAVGRPGGHGQCRSLAKSLGGARWQYGGGRAGAFAPGSWVLVSRTLLGVWNPVRLILLLH